MILTAVRAARIAVIDMVLMPVRAFIDSDLVNILTLVIVSLVLMPVRAFIDSDDDNVGHLHPIAQSLNAR